ncbi:transglutaminase-like putative cysteine protease [Kibdelosporangium banguiense]|uniref:Transglutaminase-like putative cysteine protease n=1 Tax=Kibdelosporangium banguiense TaxID=1365924 RepID=A0ABS4TB14_9PSEU|nr:transglutaminase domain-containing protein [Kibdelosporangium banguiense]MBP2321582.1 transglutaminase-like putative cysteine protease [Kibdelosporangium banguiense]
MTRRVLIEVAGSAVATLGACLLYGQFFVSNGYLLPLGIASVGGALVGAVARGWSLARTLLVVSVGFLLLATYGVFTETVAYGAPTRATATEIVWGVIGGWARMLTVGLPADVRGDLLITPVLVAWLAAFASATLAVRTRSVLAPAAPPLVAFVIALLFVGNRLGVQVTPTMVFLGGVLLLILLRTNRIETGTAHATRSGLAFGVPVVAAIVGLGILGGQLLPLASGDDRFDPRDLHTLPVSIADTLTPLAGLKSQLREQPPRRLFTIEPSDPSADRVTVAALDNYDGTLWTSTDQYVIAGRQLAATSTTAKTRSVSAHIEIDSLSGPYLPVVGRPSRLEKTDDTNEIGFSLGSGVLATTAASPRGLRYTVTGEISARDDGLPLALPSATSEFLHYTDLPNSVPTRLRELAREITADQPTPYGKLVTIERYLRNLPYSINSDPGHSVGALNRLLIGAEPRDRTGYAEQHAAAFAVLARAIGFPARVVVGYRLPPNVGGIHPVTTSDAHAWAEVAFDGYGWVTFEPTDATQTSTEPRTRSDSPVTGPQQLNPPPGAPPVVGPMPDARGQGSDGWAGVLRTTAFAAISLVSLSGVLALVIVAGKSRRRSRRRRGDSPSARVLGAWQEATDRLIERGVTSPISATADEAAAHAHEILGTAGDPVIRLAPLATTAVFAPGQLTDEDARQAWQLETALRRGLHPRRLSLRWLRARLDPRPLLAGRRNARLSRKSLRRLGAR